MAALQGLIDPSRGAQHHCSTSGRGDWLNSFQLSRRPQRSRYAHSQLFRKLGDDSQTGLRRRPLLQASEASQPVPAEGDSSSVQLKADDTYPLAKTQMLVETAMLAAVSGLAFLLSTILRLDNSLGYLLPLPIVLATLRGNVAAGWRTMVASALLLVVLLGPFRAVQYVLMHGLLAASLATLWRLQANFWLVILAGGFVRMTGSLLYLLFSSVVMNENLFTIMMSNVYALLDNVCAAVRLHGSPSDLTVNCMIFGLLLVNSLTYVFLLSVMYRIVLQAMGFSLGPLPKLIRKYLYAGLPDPQAAEAKFG